ncbi:MAG TPA: GspE/PulE family protein [Candidatus Portnoybacteria bacterium]|jgi:type IV pilus assembly protein PilB|nr:GspE/PulE family protein [Candidatus Portnoybacteria bacterium]
MSKQKSFLDFLVEKKIISTSSAEELDKEIKGTNKTMEEVISEKNLIKEEDLCIFKSQFLKIPYKNLSDFEIEPEVFRIVPLETVQHYRFIPLAIDSKKKILEAGMLNPNDVNAKEALKFLAHRNNLTPKIFIIGITDFQNILKKYATLKGEVKEALDKLKQEIVEEKHKSPATEKEQIEKIAEEAPISKVVALIIKHALEQRASDIHIEPGEKTTRVRYRVDGVLHVNLTLPLRIHPAIVSRIKILSNLKIDETRKPQDGRFFTDIDGKKIDFRVSTLPTYSGEKVVMRILDPTVGLKSLSDLGLEGRNLDVLNLAIGKPNGMILVTGPTGSGKTTTLYSILHILNQEGVNIVSLEDPIEYYIDGVSQSQVRPEIGYTFANGLRSILRQDPDKIMVGEIRDSETAMLAVHAALTGHLVLATLHTNDAIGVIPRLIDMGVDKYLIPSTLILAIAQRLVQRLCPESKKEVKPSEEILELIESQLKEIGSEILNRHNIKKPYILYEPQVSKDCPKGTKGRVGVFEIVEMTSQLEEIILKDPSELKIKEEAKRQGATSMLQDGIMKALRGIVGLEEVRNEVEE